MSVSAYLKNAEKKTYCMMAIDVEHFRLYNQLHGMEEGDNLLRFIGGGEVLPMPFSPEEETEMVKIRKGIFLCLFL